MTVVGIQFVESQEKIRHNRALEELQGKEIQVKQQEADIHAGTLNESVRHNLVSEAQNLYALESGRITAESNRRQAEVAAGRLSLDTYKYETTGRRLDESQINLNRTGSVLNLARADEARTASELNVAKAAESRTASALNLQKTLTERQNTKLRELEVKWKPIEEVEGVVSTATKSLSDIGSTIQNVTKSLTNLTKAGKYSVDTVKGVIGLIGSFATSGQMTLPGF